MHVLALAIALLVALGIIAIGVQYLARPFAATRSFGLPLPENGDNIKWWLRLKGVRDVASGLMVLAFLAVGDSRAVGIVLLVAAAIPIGDMLLILASKGSARIALGIHGLTAVFMVFAAFVLMVMRR